MEERKSLSISGKSKKSPSSNRTRPNKKQPENTIIKPDYTISGNRLTVRMDGYKLPSTANISEHWSKKANRTKNNRNIIKLVLAASGFKPELPVVVRLERLSPRLLDAEDNLPYAFKSIRDGITDWLGLKNDNHPDITWSYDQRKSKLPAIVVYIETRR